MQEIRRQIQFCHVQFCVRVCMATYWHLASKACVYCNTHTDIIWGTSACLDNNIKQSYYTVSLSKRRVQKDTHLKTDRLTFETSAWTSAAATASVSVSEIWKIYQHDQTNQILLSISMCVCVCVCVLVRRKFLHVFTQSM